ncbi:MAG: WS/DGAT/MGAT family O-acyltransferase [Mycobacteriales bacterium]
MDRLSPLDASFLYLDSSTPMHVGSLAIFETPTGGFGYDTLLELVGRRLALVPRYRQKVRQAPGKVTSPVWVDDRDFDLTHHVRLVRLAGPGSRAQLLDLVGRLLAERLDRSRPLWEIVLVEGLADGRFAIMSRTHQAMIDGSGAVDLTHVLLDGDPAPDTPPATGDTGWTPRPGPATGEMLAAGLADLVRRPWSAVETLRMAAEDSRATAGRVLGAVGGLWSAARTAARPAPASPLNPDRPAAGRRFAVAATDLDGYREVHKRQSGSTVHDVALATVTGALRTWLQHREAAVSPRAVVRALVPVSVRQPGSDVLGGAVKAYLVDLPVGEPNPVVRLHQIGFALRHHREAGQSVGADALVGLAGFAPPTLHALGARAASRMSRRLFNLVITNVPGPQVPLYAGAARMVEVYPAIPLAQGQGLAIGLTSYDGQVFYGLTGDRSALPDVDLLGELLPEALSELREGAS